MTSAYDRLRRLQNLRGAQAPRFLVGGPGSTTTIPAGPTSPAETPGTTIAATNSQTFTIYTAGIVRRWSGTFYPSGDSRVPVTPPGVAPYPPTGTIEYGGLWGTLDPSYPGSPTIVVQKVYGESAGTATYIIGVGLLAFDTSALPDGALITGATLRLYAYPVWTSVERLLSFEWASWSTPFGAAADYTPLVGTSAHPGVPVSTLDPHTFSLLEIPLLGAATGVSKTGITYLKAGITGGATATGVAGENSGSGVTWASMAWNASYPDRPDYSERLIVHYA